MAERAPAHAAVILAAGASRRLGRAKQLLRIGGETLIRRATHLALATRPMATVVVVGADADAVFAQVSDLAPTRVDCAEWQRGMGASLRAGLTALPMHCRGALIVLCDQPALDAAHLAGLCSAWRGDPVRAAASYYAGRLGVPALLPRSWFAGLIEQSSGDRGARDMLAQRAEQVIAVVNEALAADIDRAADLGAIDS